MTQRFILLLVAVERSVAPGMQHRATTPRLGGVRGQRMVVALSLTTLTMSLLQQ